MRNIILFGDSIFGRATKPLLADLESRLKDSTVHNFATGGFNSSDCLKRVEFIATLDYDNVIISIGLNDLASWKQVEISVYKENLSKILSILDSCKVVFCRPTRLVKTSKAERI